MKVGERIEWKTAVGVASGIIESEHPVGWYVRLDNGRYVVISDVSEKSQNTSMSSPAEQEDSDGFR